MTRIEIDLMIDEIETGTEEDTTATGIIAVVVATTIDEVILRVPIFLIIE